MNQINEYFEAEKVNWGLGEFFESEKNYELALNYFKSAYIYLTDK